MTGTRTYPEGVPSWIDIEQADLAAAQEFYGGLFGWTFTGDSPRMRPRYVHDRQPRWTATLRRSACRSRDRRRGTPTSQSTMPTASPAPQPRRARQVIRSPQDVGPAGRSTYLVDPSGAAFRVWQPGRRPGAQVANVPGAWNFSDLHTSDPDGAKAFYGGLFGWEADEFDAGGGQKVAIGDGPATATTSRRPLIPTSASARRASRHHLGSPTPSVARSSGARRRAALARDVRGRRS